MWPFKKKSLPVCGVCGHDERSGTMMDCSRPNCGLGRYTAFAAAQVEFSAALAEQTQRLYAADRSEK